MKEPMKIKNEYLDYVLTMAVADGLLKSASYVAYLRRTLEDVDLEAEYSLIVHYKNSELPASVRRRVVALVEYARAKENKGV